MSKEQTKTTVANVVALTLIATGATCGVASAVTGNDAGLITSSIVVVAGEAVRKK